MQDKQYTTQYPNISRGTNGNGFNQRTGEVSRMAEAFSAANKGEYLKPTTIAGFIFARITSNYLQGVQTPVSDLVQVHAQSTGTGTVSAVKTPKYPDFLKSFERVGNYLRTINEVISPLQYEVTVLQNDDGGYYVNLY